MVTFAKVVSNVFHPLTMPPIAFTLLIATNPVLQTRDKFALEAITLAFSTIFVAGFLYYLLRQGKIDEDIKAREDRILPLAVSISIYFVGFALLLAVDAPKIVSAFMFCYASNTLILLLITRWWKVSVHTTSIGGPLAALTFHFGTVMLPFYIVLPIVAVSRVILKRHTIGQVIVGALIGFGLTALQLWYVVE